MRIAKATLRRIASLVDPFGCSIDATFPDRIYIDRGPFPVAALLHFGEGLWIPATWNDKKARWEALRENGTISPSFYVWRLAHDPGVKTFRGPTRALRAILPLS